MSERPGPPITVTVPGRGSAPAELLAVGPPAPRRPPLPGRVRAVALAAVAVLGAGVLTAASYEPPPPQAAPPAPRVTGVSAQAFPSPGGPRAAELVVGFGLGVTVAGLPGRGDSGSPSEQDQLQLLELTGRGFVLRLAGEPFPVQVPQGRAPTTFVYDAQAEVADCAVEPLAPRRLELRLQRGSDVRSVLVVDVEAAVVRALDRLVAESCGRPRG